jgi:CO/xanthine dehydrogenase FAD-binding subunit
VVTRTRRGETGSVETTVPVEPPVTSPTDLAGAYAALAAGVARPIAGGTDLMVALTGELGEAPAAIVDLWHVDALRGISVDGDHLVLGALTTYTEVRRSALCHEHLPILVQAAATIGAAQIQNRGTLGGNIANASPAGDTLPVFLAADASFVLGSAAGEREVPAAEFWTAYRQTALRPDELLLRIRVPLRAGREMRFRKVGTRRAQAISKVVMALSRRHHHDDTWRDVRVALGSVAPVPIRAARTEAVLEGGAPTPELADLAAETLAAELVPIDDVRSTAEYRRVVAARLLHRLIRDAGGW